MAKKGSTAVPKTALDQRHDAFVVALKAFDSNLGGALGDEVGYTRFFKLLWREDRSWLAIIGGWDEEGAPVVCFGNGKTLLHAMGNLGRSMAADEWREDKYAK